VSGAFEIAGTAVAAGRHQVIRVPVARRASGDMLQITVHVLHGVRPGPALGLTSTSHGDEAFSIETIRRVVTSVVAVPVMNPIAFESFTRVTGQGMNTDDTNMNRVFPGNPQGWLTQQMASAVATHVVPVLTHLLDFHTGGLDSGIDYTLTEVPDGEARVKTLDLARVFGTEIVYTTEKVAFAGSLTGYARSKSVICIVPEVGGCMLGPEYQEKAVRGVRNVLVHLGMVEGEIVLPPRRIVLTKRTIHALKHGGLFYPEVGYDSLGQTVPGGTVLGRVVDPHTFEELERMTAPYEGSIMIMIRGVLSRVNPGDYGYIIGDAATARDFS
jgi:predicted deacylase